MSEKTTIICDYCQADITSENHYPSYRIRVSEEHRKINLPIVNTASEAEIKEGIINFCSLNHLKNWIANR